jgi:hypothetical protein
MPSPPAGIVATWNQLVAGWADHLDASGANLLIDGVRNHAEPRGSYEGVTRMLWGIGGWLSRPERPASVTWRGREYDLEHLMRRALLAGTDPAGDAYWGDPVSTGAGQPTVESGQVAYALWQTHARIWDRLSTAEQRQVADWLIACGQPPEQRWRNNWALFWAVNHVAREALGLPFDAELVDDVMGRYLDAAYVGDGWYDDGPARGTGHFDDYNLWVFASHVLAWIDIGGGEHPDRAAELRDRVRLLMAHVPCFFAADGAYPEYGRSGAYKFARLGALVWAYRHGAWPHAPGLLRTIVERHLGWYVRHGAIRADGTLRQALTSTGSDAIRETYISTGATYWAMQAFGAFWSLPDDDPLWSAKPEPLPIERGDVREVFTEPGWIVAGTRESGQIHRYTTHVSYYPEKYAKLAYSTAAPYNAGLGDGRPTPDAMVGIVVDGHVSHRTANEAAAIGAEGWIRYRHRHELAGVAATFDTIIVPDGDLHLRVHRLVETSGDAALAVLEGAAALGFDHGDHPRLTCDPARGISGGVTIEHAVAMRVWDAHRAPRLPRSFADGGTGNIVHACNVIPFVAGEATAGDVLVATVFLGTAAQMASAGVEERLADEPEVTVDPDGTVRVAWRGRELLVSPL